MAPRNGKKGGKHIKDMLMQLRITVTKGSLVMRGGCEAENTANQNTFIWRILTFLMD